MSDQTRRLIAVALLAFAGWQVYQQPPAKPDGKPSPKQPCPPDGPCPVPVPKPKPKPKPWGPQEGAVAPLDPVGASVGGNVAPDGSEICCDLPGELHRKNTASKGLGLCVFTSIHHAGLWQNVPAVQEMPRWMIAKGIPGGGYPSKVAELIPKIASERGLPTPDFIQVERADYDLVVRACQSGRMPCVTYSRSPTGRYGGSRIAHMVSLPHADPRQCAVLDNNYIGSNAYEWMTPAEAKAAGVLDWVVVFLSPPPPPPPTSRVPQEIEP